MGSGRKIDYKRGYFRTQKSGWTNCGCDLFQLLRDLKILKFGFSLCSVFTKYIDSIQQYSTSKIQVNSTLTDPFFIRKEVRQEDPISPTLFIIALNPLLFKIQFETSISPVPNPIGERTQNCSIR